MPGDGYHVKSVIRSAEGSNYKQCYSLDIQVKSYPTMYVLRSRLSRTVIFKK